MRRKFMRLKLPAFLPCAAALALLPCATALAQTAGTAAADAADNIYGPFNPVPDTALRALTTDRPGKSSSPVTVDAGHVQIEADLFNYSYTDADSTTTRQWSAPNVLVKYGVSRWVDVEVGISGVNQFEYHDHKTGQIVKADGIGDTWVGAKFNVFGDDPGDGPANQGFAVIPMVKVPTAAEGLGNHLVEATVTLPYQYNLPDNWSVVVENVDGLRANHTGDGYEGDYQGMINVSHPLFFDDLTAQVEYFYDHANDPVLGNQMSFDPSVQWQVTKGLALDMGDYIGLNAKTPAENPYVGISTRF
jgi:hypothetical protein